MGELSVSVTTRRGSTNRYLYNHSAVSSPRRTSSLLSFPLLISSLSQLAPLTQPFPSVPSVKKSVKQKLTTLSNGGMAQLLANLPCKVNFELNLKDDPSHVASPPPPRLRPSSPLNPPDHHPCRSRTISCMR